MIVLDTNVLSEFMNRLPSAVVMDWLSQQDPSSFATTSVTIAELRSGAERKREPADRDAVHEGIDRVLRMFAERRPILVMDESAGAAAGLIAGRLIRVGRTIDAPDAYIAGICAVHGATLATRNIKHFVNTGIDLVNPWDAS